MTRQGNWQDMPAIITDEMLDKFVPRDTYQDIAEVYRQRYGGLASRITFPMPENPQDDHLCAAVIQQLRAA